jgi:hypothetical protein
MSLRLFFAGAAFALAAAAAPIVLAQPSGPPTDNPGQSSGPIAIPGRAPGASSTAPNDAVVPGETAGAAAATAAAPAKPAMTPVSYSRQCRTRHEVDESCSCLSAPTSMGKAQAAPNGGKNLCMVP